MTEELHPDDISRYFSEEERAEREAVYINDIERVLGEVTRELSVKIRRKAIWLLHTCKTEIPIAKESTQRTVEILVSQALREICVGDLRRAWPVEWGKKWREMQAEITKRREGR